MLFYIMLAYLMLIVCMMLIYFAIYFCEYFISMLCLGLLTACLFQILFYIMYCAFIQSIFLILCSHRCLSKGYMLSAEIPPKDNHYYYIYFYVFYVSSKLLIFSNRCQNYTFQPFVKKHNGTNQSDTANISILTNCKMRFCSTNRCRVSASSI